MRGASRAAPSPRGATLTPLARSRSANATISAPGGLRRGPYAHALRRGKHHARRDGLDRSKCLRDDRPLVSCVFFRVGGRGGAFFFFSLFSLFRFLERSCSDISEQITASRLWKRVSITGEKERGEKLSVTLLPSPLRKREEGGKNSPLSAPLLFFLRSKQITPASPLEPAARARPCSRTGPPPRRSARSRRSRRPSASTSTSTPVSSMFSFFSLFLEGGKG